MLQVALQVLNSPKVLPAHRPHSRPLVLKVLKVLDSQVLLKVLPLLVHHLLQVHHRDHKGHQDPPCPLLQANQVLLLDPQVLYSPKDPVCPHHPAHLLNHLDLKDLALPLDHLDLALLLHLYHLRVLKAHKVLKCQEHPVLLRDLVLPSDRDSLVHHKDQVDPKLHSHPLDLKDQVPLLNHLDPKDLVLPALPSHLLSQTDQLLLQDPLHLVALVHPVLPVDLVPLHNHLAQGLPVLLKDQECLKVLRVLSLVKLLKDLALQAFLRVLPQHLHQEALVVPSNLVALLRHLHPKDPELFQLPLDLKDQVLQVFLRAPDQDSHLVDSMPLKAQASLKDLTAPNSHFHPKAQVELAVSQAFVVLLKLLLAQVALVVLLKLLLDQEALVLVPLKLLKDQVALVLHKLLKDQEHLELLTYQELQVHLLMVVSKLLRDQVPLVVEDLQAQVFHH